MKSFYSVLFSLLTCTRLFSQGCNFICNGGFDNTFITSSVTQLTLVPCWNTMESDGKMEVWACNFNSVPCYNGIQFVELNANGPSTMYQDFNVSAGVGLTIGFAHRGCAGTDTMGVAIGPVGGPYTSLGKWGDGTTAWGYYTTNYTTGSAGSYRILFTPIYWAGNNPAIGNFLDSVSVQGTSNLTVVASPTTACAGSTINLTASGGVSYTWTGGPSSPVYSVSPTTTTIYTLTGVDAGGCSGIRTITVTISQPSVNILNVTGSPSITCITPSIQLAALTMVPGTFNYFWTSNSFTATTQTITVTNPSTLIAVNMIDPVTGCAATATTSIKINITPPVSSVGPVNQSIGCGPGIVATATGVAISPTTNVTHAWYTPLSSAPALSGGPTSLFSPPAGPPPAGMTSTFVLTDNINGCSTSKTVNVVSTGGAYPTFTVTSAQQFSIGCASTATTNIVIAGAQSASAGVISYTILYPGFSGGNTYTTGSVNIYLVNAPGTYTVIVKDNANNCETHLPVSILQNTFAPDISVTVPTYTLDCSRTSLVLQGQSANSLQGPVSFDWSFQNGGNPGHVLNSLITVNTNAAAPSTTIINTYSLTVTEANNACVNSTVVTVYQNTRPPIARISVTSPSLTCSTNSISLTNSSQSGVAPNTFFISQPIIGLSWAGPSPQLPDSNSSSYYAYTPGVYTMTAEDLNNGCTSQTVITITDSRVYPDVITNSVVALDCGAATTGGVKLAATAFGLSPNQVTAQWFLPLPTPNVSGANTLTLTTVGLGQYQLVVTTNSNQCTRQVFINVVQGVLNADFIPDKDTGFPPLTVTFSNTSTSSSSTNGTASITSVWSFGNGTMRTTTTNLSTSALYTAPGIYTVTLFASKGGCRDTVVKVITLDIPSMLTIPNIFTPNGDNSNDVFFVQSANHTEISAQIFDRWGNKVYDLTSGTGNIAWDGKNQAGKDVAVGTYIYVIRATGKDGQNYDAKGPVSLYR